MKSGAPLILVLWLALLGVQAACAGGVLDHCTQGHREHPVAGADACGADPCAQDYDAPGKMTRTGALTPPACLLPAPGPAVPPAAATAPPPVPATAPGEPARPAGAFPLLI